MNDNSYIAVFLFYNISNGTQTFLSFSKTLKHCNVILYDGQYVNCVEMDSEGLKIVVREINDIHKFIKKLQVIPEITAIITTYVKKRFKTSWKPFFVRSCNEICRITSGIDIGFTFNPKHLYKKIFKYDHNGYEVISAWRRIEYGNVLGR